MKGCSDNERKESDYEEDLGWHVGILDWTVCG